MENKNILLKIALGACLLTVGSAPVWAQSSASARASIDSTYVIIGSPTTIHLEVTLPEGTPLVLPKLQPSIVAMDEDQTFQLEVSSVSEPDTVRTGSGNLITLRRDVEVFAFDSATLYIPPFDFVAGTDTISTNALALKVVVPFDVEVDPQKFCDIKEPIKPDFVWTDYLWWVLGPLAALLVVGALIYWFAYYLPRHRKVKVEEKAPEVLLPPHEEAMQALQALEARKLWQDGHYKRYYTGLTDILRNYIDRRFSVSTLEKTSDEILRQMRVTDGITTSSLQNLRQVLQLADLVKFARYAPLADENQLSLMNAKMFISQTVEVKSVDTTPAITDVPDASTEGE